LTAPLTIDKYESLSGKALVRHFELMDSLLWKSLSLIAQTGQDYLLRSCLTPIIRDITGTSHGRRWFTRKDIRFPLTRLLEIIRLWRQSDFTWDQFLTELHFLSFYRDTLRSWVEKAEVDDAAVAEHVKRYYKLYLVYREEVTCAYLPLVWKAATSHGFNDDTRQDLFQIGTTGLLHATERYNNVDEAGQARPVTFSTFANRWIRQAILMHISRKMPLIQVSHSVLEEESKILRRERESGKEDRSPRAQRIKRMSSTKDVLLVDEVEAEQTRRDEPVVDLQRLPQYLRRVVIFRHGLIEHAKPGCTDQQLVAERTRQFEILQHRLL